MHRIKQWAHSSAHESHYNPWAPPSSVSVAAGLPAAATTIQHGSKDITDQQQGQPQTPEHKDKPRSRGKHILYTTKKILLHSWVNVLLVFVPVGIAVNYAGVNQNVVFALNAVAVIPLAGLLTFATESVAHRLGPTLGALLNVSFGNAVELIIFIIALVKNEIRIVQASLIGSILANLLLILGMAFLIGGLEYQEQLYDSLVTQMSAALLALAVLSLLIPTAFHASFNDLALADQAVLPLSRGTSVILLIIYILYLLFQLKSHSYLYKGIPQHVIDEESMPGFLARFDSVNGTSPSSSSSSASSIASTKSGSHRRVSKRLRAKLGRKRKEKVEVEEGPVDDIAAQASTTAVDGAHHSKGKSVHIAEPPVPITEKAATTPAITDESTRPTNPGRGFSFRPPPVFRATTDPMSAPQPHAAPSTAPHHLRRLVSQGAISQTASHPGRGPQRVGSNLKEPEATPPELGQISAIILLLISTALVALCAEFMVGSIEHLVENSPLSEAFVGLIILPIVGNAAEHVTAVTVAAKNKLDLALGVALGSSIQIALFVTPIIVILGWILNKEMTLYFSLFETATLFVSTFIVNFLVLDGRSNYLEGALLCACYVIIAVGAFYFPDQELQSASTRSG